MSSTRNTKRKRSNAGAPATSSTRHRAVAPEPAHDSIRTEATEASEASPPPDNNNNNPHGAMVSETTPASDCGNTTKESPSTGTGSSPPKEAPKQQDSGTTNAGNGANNTTHEKSAATENDTMDSKTSATDTNPAASQAPLETADASSTCTSSQDGTASTRRQAQHVVNEEDDREQRLKDLISHRTVLLQRVRACRKTAEERIGTNQNQGNSTTSSVVEEDDQEIAAFKTMTKQANQAARKLREAEGVTEKRTSLSLRRGSNIGKRMNAALSSLVPGSSVAAAVAADTAGQTQVGSGSTSAANTTVKSEKGISPSSSTKHVSPKNAGRLPTQNMGDASAQTPPVAVKSTAATKSVSSTKQYDGTPARGRPQNTKNSKTIKSGLSLTLQPGVGGGMNPTAAPGQSLKKNLLGSPATRGINPHLLASYQGPKVHFAEAVILRERRDQVEMKLRSLLERQQKQQQQHLRNNNNMSSGASMVGASMMPGGNTKLLSTSSSMEDDITRRAAAAGSTTNKKVMMQQSIHGHSSNTGTAAAGLEITPPAPLPRRRRTHWDTVLQEMSWLAADFIEERKWKLSTSRLISSKIPPHGLSESRRKRSPEAGIARSVDGSHHSDTTNTSAMAVDALETSSESQKKNKDTRRKYTTPGTDDEEVAKCNSQVLSSMITELEGAILKGGSLGASDTHHQQALENFISIRAKILGTVKDSDAKNDTPDRMKVDDDTDDENQAPGLDSIDDYVDHFHALSKSKHKLPAKETAKALKSGKMKLTSKQKEMFEFVDKLWTGKPCSGAWIAGPSVCGKTFVTATILWKQRFNGFQILICPSRSLIRWRHELNRFSDIRVLAFGLTGGISNPNEEKNNVKDIDSADVVLCEYASVGRMTNALSKLGVCPFSVVVDLRNFLGLRKSLGSSPPMSPENGDEDDANFPSELKSNGWWKDVHAVSKHRNTRCLFLDYRNNDPADPLSLSHCCQGQKEQIAILANRAACILGPNLFDISDPKTSYSIQRQILTWARKKGKKDTTGDKALRVKTILTQAIEPLCFRVDKPIVPSMDYDWDLRLCTMTAVQREEYEKCCHEVRGALASSLLVENDKGNLESQRTDHSIPIVSNALFRLRQQCFHSRQLAIESPSLLYDNLSSGNASRRGAALMSNATRGLDLLINSSQPDANTVQSILNSSTKMVELVSILVKEGGCHVNLEEGTKNVLGIPSLGGKKGNDAKPSTKKILIFAALPNIQRIISVLLDSLGIQNELLLRPGNGMSSRLGDDNGDESSSLKLDRFKDKFGAIAWTKIQRTLSIFNSDVDYGRNSNVIVASPAAFSGRNDGIGVEGADIIITLDSDWSHRDCFIVDSLLRRWSAKNMLSGKEDRLMRLICEGSIEAKVFSDDNSSDYDVSEWPLDSEGFLTLPKSEEEASNLYTRLVKSEATRGCVFPAVDVLRGRGDMLNEILGSSSQLPSFFGSGESAKFLPLRDNTEQEAIAELNFLQHFLANERLGCVVESESKVLVTVSTEAKVTALMGLPSREDISVIESRLFLEELLHSNSSTTDAVDGSFIHTRQPNLSLSNGAKSAEDLAISKIEENPSSLLFYEPRLCPHTNADNELSTMSKIKSIGGMTQRRCNAYAKLFSRSWNGIGIRDGNQGCEPLVFFPPLFPLIEIYSKKTRVECNLRAVTHPPGTAEASISGDNNSSVKRKDGPSMLTQIDTKQEPKRTKTEPIAVHGMNGLPTAVPSLRTGIPQSPGTQSLNQTGNCKATTISPNSEKSEVDESSGFIMPDEDFGLLGNGSFPRPIDAVSFSAYDSKSNTSSMASSDQFDFLCNKIPCDTEETNISASKAVHEGMGSVLLFVKKRPRSSQLSYKYGQGLSSIAPLPTGNRLLGDDLGNKKKKKGPQGITSIAPTAFTRVPGNTCNPQAQILQRMPIATSRPMKGDYRHRLLSSFYARQRATGLTLFDSVSYRVAAMRVEERVVGRLEKLMMKSTINFDSGPGLPMHLIEKSILIEASQRDQKNGCASIIEELRKGTSAGDAARERSRIQKLGFHRSSVSPRSVDFGAFEAGYLASPSGMTFISSPRFRVGVSLPMGVKVMEPFKDGKTLSTWNMSDDKLLIRATKNFSLNWLLVACALSGFENVIIEGNAPDTERIVSSAPKSARQCRDRWRILAQNQPSLIDELRRSERVFRERASLTHDTISDIDVTKIEEELTVLSVSKVRIFCKSSEFLLPTKENIVTLPDTIQRGEKSSLIGGSFDSPRSTVDKKDEETTDKHKINGSEKGNPNDAGAMIQDVNMTEVVPPKEKLKRRSFSAISIAKSRMQVFPITIPGVDMGGNQAGHPVPSHPSHMQSVQMSPTAQWASGRTEMWPLQILDLADRQRNSAARVSSMQRGDLHPAAHPAAHNSRSRHHTSASASYQHRSQPSSQSSAARAPVAYPPAMSNSGQTVGQRPINPPVTPHHQHRGPPVGTATAQAYIPPPSSTTTKPKTNDNTMSQNKTSPKKG